MADIPILNRRQAKRIERNLPAKQHLNREKIAKGLKDALIAEHAMPVSNFVLPVTIENDDEIVVDLFIPACPPVAVYFKLADAQLPVSYETNCKHFGQSCNYWIITEYTVVEKRNLDENQFVFTDESEEQIKSCTKKIVAMQKSSRIKLFKDMDERSLLKKYSSAEGAFESFEKYKKNRISEIDISKLQIEEKIKEKNRGLLAKNHTKNELSDINKEIEAHQKTVDDLRNEKEELNNTHEEPAIQDYFQKRKDLFNNLQELEKYNLKTPSILILLISEALPPSNGTQILNSYNQLLSLFYANYYDMAVLMAGKLVERILSTLCNSWGIKVVSGVFTYINDMKKKADDLQNAIVSKTTVQNGNDNSLQILKDIQNKTTDIAHSMGKGDLSEQEVYRNRSTYSLLNDLMKTSVSKNMRKLFEKNLVKLLNKIMAERNSVAHSASDKDKVFTATQVDEVFMSFSKLLFGFSYLIQEYAFVTFSRNRDVNAGDKHVSCLLPDKNRKINASNL